MTAGASSGVTLEAAGTKSCSKCGRVKARGEFSKNRSNKDGLQAWCRGCDAANKRSWRLKNPEKVAAHHRAWALANHEKVAAASRAWRLKNPEKVAAHHRAWALANPEKGAAASRAWRLKNPEKVAAQHRAWALANPEKRAARSARRLAREASAPGGHSPKQLAARFAYFGNRCAYCGSDGGGKPLEVDHTIPLSKGGSQWPSNLRPACPKHNSSKKDALLKDWRWRPKTHSHPIVAAPK